MRPRQLGFRCRDAADWVQRPRPRNRNPWHRSRPGGGKSIFAADPLANPVEVSCGDAWPWCQFLPVGESCDGAGASRFRIRIRPLASRSRSRGSRKYPRLTRGAADGSAERSRTVPREAGLSSATPMKNVRGRRRRTGRPRCIAGPVGHPRRRLCCAWSRSPGIAVRTDSAGVSEVEGHGGVVGQVGADAGQVRHDGNAKFTKVPGGADARPQQQRRGAVRASAQNDPEARISPPVPSRTPSTLPRSTSRPLTWCRSAP